MIECSNELLYYKRKNRKINFKRFFCIFIIIFILISGFIYYKKVTTPLIERLCFDKISSTFYKSVNNSIISTISTNVTYDDLVHIEKNDNGDISLISANSKMINDISRKIVLETEKTINEKLKNGVKIPFLAFTGLSFLSGYGKEINLKVLSVESVDVKFNSEFISSGINQTLHKISVEIISDISLSFPTYRESKEFSSSVLISEAVLVGKVPEIYLSGKGLS